MLQSWSPSRKLATLVLIVVVGALAAGAASRGGDAGTNDAGGTQRTTSTTGAASSGGGGTSTTDQAGVTTTTTGVDGETASAETPLPVQPTVENTTDLRDLDEVRVTVQADADSQIYAVEARLCREGTVVRNDGDMLPSVSGQCAAHPLSPGADSYLKVAGTAPFRKMVAAFKVGTGTDTFPMDDGSTGEVTCDAGHPCVLAVKFQIPNGFGFRTYPVTFA